MRPVRNEVNTNTWRMLRIPGLKQPGKRSDPAKTALDDAIWDNFWHYFASEDTPVYRKWQEYWLSARYYVHSVVLPVVDLVYDQLEEGR